MRTWLVFLILMIPMVLVAGTVVPAPPTEFTQAHPQTSAWALGITFTALVVAVVIISRMVTSNVDRALRRNEDEIRGIKADARALDTRLTILETQHRSNHGGENR